MRNLRKVSEHFIPSSGFRVADDSLGTTLVSLNPVLENLRVADESSRESPSPVRTARRRPGLPAPELRLLAADGESGRVNGGNDDGKFQE